jgi:uncharacterized membrane protein YfcA
MSVLAGAVAAVSGFGIGSLLTPVLLVGYGTAEAVAIVSIPHAVASSVRLARMRGDVDRAVFRQFGLASAAGGLIGAVAQSRLTSPALGLVLGGLLLMAGAAELFGRRLPPPPTAAGRLAVGGLAGFFGGLVGNQGGMRAAALTGYRMPARAMVATTTASAVLVDLARVPIYAVSAPDVLRDGLPLIGIASAGVIAGTFLGGPLLARIPEAQYHRWLGALLMLIGVGLVARSLS